MDGHSIAIIRSFMHSVEDSKQAIPYTEGGAGHCVGHQDSQR